MAESKSSSSGICPSCKQAIPPQAVLCVHCGLNIKTGQRVATDIQGKKVYSHADKGMTLSDKMTYWMDCYRNWVVWGGVAVCVLLLYLLFSYRSSNVHQYTKKEQEYSQAITDSVEGIVLSKLGKQTEGISTHLEFKSPFFPLSSPSRLEFKCLTYRTTSKNNIVLAAKSIGFLDLNDPRLKMRSMIGRGLYELDINATQHSAAFMRPLASIAEHLPLILKSVRNLATYERSGRASGATDKSLLKHTSEPGGKSESVTVQRKNGKASMKLDFRKESENISITLRKAQVNGSTTHATLEITSGSDSSVVELIAGNVEGTLQDVYED